MNNGREQFVFLCASQELTLAELPLIHPLAGCVESPVNPNGAADCLQWANRDLVEEFFAGSAQLFQNELAAVSWNFLMFLAISSCDLNSPDLDGETHRAPDGSPTFADDPECFLPSEPYRPDRCSLASPNLCTNVKAFFAAAGVGRDTVRAAGNSRFGRRTFIWHSGGEAVLRYDRRNVLGFATDFAEDWSRTSWAIEADLDGGRALRGCQRSQRHLRERHSSPSRCRSIAPPSCASSTRTAASSSTPSGT